MRGLFRQCVGGENPSCSLKRALTHAQRKIHSYSRGPCQQTDASGFQAMFQFLSPGIVSHGSLLVLPWNSGIGADDDGRNSPPPSPHHTILRVPGVRVCSILHTFAFCRADRLPRDHAAENYPKFRIPTQIRNGEFRCRRAWRARSATAFRFPGWDLHLNPLPEGKDTPEVLQMQLFCGVPAWVAFLPKEPAAAGAILAGIGGPPWIRQVGFFARPLP